MQDPSLLNTTPDDLYNKLSGVVVNALGRGQQLTADEKEAIVDIETKSFNMLMHTLSDENQLAAKALINQLKSETT